MVWKDLHQISSDHKNQIFEYRTIGQQIKMYVFKFWNFPGFLSSLHSYENQENIIKFEVFLNFFQVF